jgi:hypothetical protein
MAIQNFGTLIIPPMPLMGANSVALTQVSSLTADTALAAYVVQIAKAGNIRKVRWGTRTVTTGGDMDVRLETVDAATGHPSGTLWGTTTNGTQAVANGDDNVWFTTTLTADATVAVGDILAVCIKAPAGVNLNVLTSWALSSLNLPFPYFRFFNGTSWAGVGSGAPMVMLEYDDGSYAPLFGCYPAGNVTSHSVSTSTTPDVVGLRFQVPYPLRVKGAWAVVDIDGDCALRLVSTAYHQGAGTGILGSITLDKDIRTSTATGPLPLFFSSPIDLSPATWYRLVLEPTSTTAITGPYDIEVPTLAGLDSWVSQNWHLTSAKDPTVDGDWTNYNSGTFRVPPLMGLIVGGVDDAVSAGSGGVSRNRWQRRM